MAYIGKTPVIGNFVKLDSITTVNGQAAYTMQNGGSNFTDYESVNQFLVSLNGTIQSPTDSFTVSGSTLTFASNLSTGDVIDFIMVFGNSLSAGTPTDGTVTAAKIASDAVTTAKINNNAVTSAKMFSSFANGITEADQWRITADHSGVADITANWERVDTDGFNYIGTGMSESSGIFTFPSTGIYRITFNATAYTSGGGSNFILGRILTTLDNSSYNAAASGYLSTSGDGVYQSLSIDFIFDVTSTSTHKCKFRLAQNNANTPIFVGSTNENYTCATFIRIGDT